MEFSHLENQSAEEPPQGVRLQFNIPLVLGVANLGASYQPWENESVEEPPEGLRGRNIPLVLGRANGGFA